MALRELRLPLWDIAKAKCRVLQRVKRQPIDRKKLERYLRVVDDFVESHHYESVNTPTLRSLVDSSITWAWNQRAQGELLVLLNAKGIYFPRKRKHSMQCRVPLITHLYWPAAVTALRAHSHSVKPEDSGGIY
jgi:hypothetical protein